MPASVMLMLLFLIIVSLTESAEVVEDDSCPLLWNSKQNLGVDQGFQLQVCCNISSVSLRPLSGPDGWTLGEVVYEKDFEDEPLNFWSDLLVSICDDKSGPTLGYAEAREGVKCEHERGQILNVPSEAVELNKWYLVCYEKATGCSQCHIDVICDSEFTEGCANTWMQNSVSYARNDSLHMWLRIGQMYPFINQSSILITVRDQARGNVVGTYKQEPVLGKQLELDLDGLEPNGWYLVETCLIITPPSNFASVHGVAVNRKSKHTCQRGSYRTKSSNASFTSTTLLFLSAVLLLLFI